MPIMAEEVQQRVTPSGADWCCPLANLLIVVSIATMKKEASWLLLLLLYCPATVLFLSLTVPLSSFLSLSLMPFHRYRHCYYYLEQAEKNASVPPNHAF